MLILVTGGSASGKSAYAESLCLGDSPRVYLACMQPFGTEGARRIERHRAMRKDKGFLTVERYTDLASLILPPCACVLLEDLGNLAANEMFSSEPPRDPYDAVIGGVDALQKQCERLVVVTDEIGSDGVQYDPATTAYIAALETANRALSARADAVIEVVAGFPIPLKGELPV
ncbi:MAG: bifunctional adenosylcobinamide kinase/adenosylcobinamide-phosphate guanylyltransferase [Clostridia bacterium]|nr:bifunctional adenosylcobinamide kinase/adenosylcobinamide-phosphate guanylyltransferase [Clostridia bacterium]